MTASETAVTLCGCGHAERMHERDAAAEHDRGACMQRACGCSEYRAGATVRSPAPRPASAGATTAPPAVPNSVGPLRPPQTGLTAEQLIAAAQRSPMVTTRRLGERITKQLDDLKSRLAEERAAAARKAREEEERQRAKREVEDLEAKLAEAKARLKPERAKRTGAETASDRKAN